MITSSGLLWAGLFGILDGVECGADVKVFGLKETSQPSAFISEPHRQHESQRLHQVGVCLCGGGQRSLKGGVRGACHTQDSKRSGVGCGLTLRQVRVESRLPQTCWTLLCRRGTLVQVLVPRLEGLQLSSGGVDLSGAQVSPLLIRVSAYLKSTDWVRFTGYTSLRRITVGFRPD